MHENGGASSGVGEGAMVYSRGWQYMAHVPRLAARQLFRVLPCRKGTIDFQTSIPSPGSDPRTYGTAVSVTNHYTGWRNEMEYHSELVEALGNNALPYRTIARWIGKFQHGRVSTTDEQRS
ncbi:hypothetical protein TNCV_1000451 [Trichonephila clavipes]|nr:hypothetical protein TNCV_1000451 [Trichonephila clavipes]